LIREFRLSPPGRGGVSCDANGAFVGCVSLLQRSHTHGDQRWEPRDCEQLSHEIGSEFGLPIDLSKKAGGLKAICNALNEGDVARAQIATVLLGIPEPPHLTKRVRSESEMITFIRDLHWSGLIKRDWDPDFHPRWPAGAPESQGGEFAPISGYSGVSSSSGDDAASDDGVHSSGNDLVEPDSTGDIQIAAAWPSNGPPDEAAVCARFARWCILLAPLFLSGDTPQRVPFHDHHIFPQQFRQYFEQRGIDIDQYTVTMDASTHLEGVHGAGIDGIPGQWNKAWADFIAKNPTATRQQLFDFAGQLMKRYGISSSEIHPYGKLP